MRSAKREFHLSMSVGSETSGLGLWNAWWVIKEA